MKKLLKKYELFLLMIPAVFFGAGAFITGKIGILKLSWDELTFLRFLIASAIILPLVLKKEHKNLKLKKNDAYIVILAGLFGMFGYHALFFMSLEYITAINSALLMATTPMVTSIIAAIVLGEYFGIKRIFAVFIAFFGVLITITNGNLEVLKNLSFNIGDVIMFSAVLCMALYAVLSKKVAQKYSPSVILTYGYILTVVLLIPYMILKNPINAILNASLETWLSIIYMAVFASVLAQLLQQISLKYHGASKTMLFYQFVPIIVIMLSAIFLREPFTKITAISTLFIMSGVYINSTIKRD
ncbi:DMT family transporter [Methanococcus maripaludis]|uniref:Drug/metabolite transporter (DMT)-like permease n=1 Tax=Methanococcus maripaludis TaxID=39152 RepID=A0A7J9PPH1_METMI|nr:DMT family transporter [Methanococcus maripaludis]MBA2864684.1 drug/metabolite transporter (DMT)-like permease [Methanococcus maripaludis]